MFKEENGIFKYTQKLIVEIVGERDKYIKDVIVRYAMEQSKKHGERIDVLFMEKEIVEEIIELGIKEYMRMNKK